MKFYSTENLTGCNDFYLKTWINIGMDIFNKRSLINEKCK